MQVADIADPGRSTRTPDWKLRRDVVGSGRVLCSGVRGRVARGRATDDGRKQKGQEERLTAVWCATARDQRVSRSSGSAVAAC